MNILNINIYEEKHIKNCESIDIKHKHIYYNMFKTDENYDELRFELDKYFENNILDGYSTIVAKYNSTTDIDIYVFDIDKYLGKIITYLETSFEKLDDFEELDSEEVLDSNFIINCSHEDVDDVISFEEELKKILMDNNIKYNIAKREVHSTNYGADGVAAGVIILLLSQISAEIWGKLKKDISEKKEFRDFVEYGAFDTKQLRLNFAYKINDPNYKNFKIDKFENLDNEKYKVIMRGKIRRHELICDSEANILEIRVI